MLTIYSQYILIVAWRIQYNKLQIINIYTSAAAYQAREVSSSREFQPTLLLIKKHIMSNQALYNK